MTSPRISFVEKPRNVVRDCPGTRNHICCGYKTIDLIEGCLLGCSYCILRGYIDGSEIKVNRNVGPIISQIDEEIIREQAHILRFGTGELSDSLALDRRFRLNESLVRFFGEKRRAILELKSKWASVDHLRPVLNPYTVISFSLNPQRIIDREEQRTSPLYKRLKAARKAQEWGCYVGLHFDPIIIYDGFEKDYQYLIDDVARILDLERVIWVSLGLLRFPPRLYDLFLEERRQNLLYGEFIRGEDGKYRYIKSERIKVYRMIYDLLKGREENLFLYLCMERSDVWKEVMGRTLTDSKDLVTLFDERVRTFYGGSI